jgi:hypothetical protein
MLKPNQPLSDSELRAIARLPETVQLVIDYYHVQEAEADAVGVVECVKYSENRRKELESLRDELLAKRCEAPGEIRFTSQRHRTLKRIRFLFATTTYCDVVEVAISNFFTWLEDRPASEKEADAELIAYEYDGVINHLSRGDLAKATIACDGKFRLEGGTELYLIDQDNERWAPIARGESKSQDATGTRSILDSEDVYQGETVDRENYLAEIKESVPKDRADRAIDHFVRAFRASRTPALAQQLREAAVGYVKEGLIEQADHDAYWAETESVLSAFRETPAGRPDPDLPFYGCKLPKEIVCVELVSSDARALDWHDHRTVECYSDGMLDWLESGMEPDESAYDLGDEVLQFSDGARTRHVSGRALVEAKLDTDGRFTLKDGTEFYLIQDDGKRWCPKDRVVA